MNLQEIKKELNLKYFESLKEFNKSKEYNELTQSLNLNEELNNKIDTTEDRTFISITKTTRDTLNLQMIIYSSALSYYDHQDDLDRLINLYETVKINSNEICKLFINNYFNKVLSSLQSALKEIGINKVILATIHKYPFCKNRETFYTAYDVESNSIEEHHIVLGDFKRIFYQDFPRLLLRYNRDSRYKELTQALNFSTQYNNEPYTLTSDISLRDCNYIVNIKKLKSNKLEIGVRFNNYPDQYSDDNNFLIRYKSVDYKRIERKKLVNCNKVSQIFLTDYLLPYVKQFSKILLNNGITKVNIISEFGYPYYGKGIFEETDIKIS